MRIMNTQFAEMLDSITTGEPGTSFLQDEFTDLMDMSLSKLRELVMDRNAGVLQSMGSQRVGHD